MTMAKAITNGAQRRWARWLPPSDIYDTITNAGPAKGDRVLPRLHLQRAPACAAAGLAMMNIFRKEKLVERAARDVAVFHRCHVLAVRLAGGGRHPRRRHAGSGGSGRGRYARCAARMQKRLFDAGVNIKSTGDNLIIAPPFISEKSHIDHVVSVMRDVLAKGMRHWRFRKVLNALRFNR